MPSRENRIKRHGTVDSTNERAFAAIETGAASAGDVHVARAQTQGRGRRGSRWESAPAEGLYLSLILLPDRPLQPAALTMGAGLALWDALRPLDIEDLRLKWPNDLMIGPAKLAGILVESRGGLPRPHAVVGIGVNVLQTRFPDALTRSREVASLRSAGVDCDPEELLQRLLPPLNQRLADAARDPESVAGDYLLATGLEGAAVRLQIGDETLAGRLEALDLADGVRLRGPDGQLRSLRLEHITALEKLQG